MKAAAALLGVLLTVLALTAAPTASAHATRIRTDPMRPPTSRGPCSLWLAATSDDRRLAQRRVPVPAGTDGRQTRHQSSLNCRRITPLSLGFSFSVSRVMLRPGAT